jgi:hypothetical protein
LYDFFDSYEQYENNIFHPEKSIKINTLYNYMRVQHNIDFYDFNIEESE